MMEQITADFRNKWDVERSRLRVKRSRYYVLYKGTVAVSLAIGLQAIAQLFV